MSGERTPFGFRKCPKIPAADRGTLKTTPGSAEPPPSAEGGMERQ